jgi:hypothetical protein
VGRKFIPDDASPFYPPRARWYSVFLYFGHAIVRRFPLERLTLPREMKIGELAAGFLIPGLAVWLRGPRQWGRAALAGSAALLLIFIIWLGYPAANAAFGLMISLHASGFVYYCSPLMAGENLRSRLAFTILVLLALGLGFYLPIQHAVQTHWLMPLRNGNQVIIVAARGRPDGLKQGDWAAFTTEKGIVFGPVVGLGGNRVNSITVPEDHWLIREQIARRYYHDLPFVSFHSDVVEQLTVVSRQEFAGTPLHHWFWRKQTLPPAVVAN